jgi:hypothetical protein
MGRRALRSFLTTFAISMLVIAAIAALRGGTQADWLTLAIVASFVAFCLWLAPRIRPRRP